MLAGICLFGAVPAPAEQLSTLLEVSAQPHYSQVGMASWYGDDFHGHATANGEMFDVGSLSAAHRTLPLPCYARVTNLRNGRSIVVRVNDRGPFVGGRMLDVSARVARLLDFDRLGAARIRLDYIGMAPAAGGDESVLLASLRPGVVAGPKRTGSALRTPAESGVTVVVETPKPADPHSPWGELVTYPFLVRTAGD